MTKDKKLILSDIDGTINTGRIISQLNHVGYFFKEYDPNVGLINRLLKEHKEEISLNFFTNGVSGYPTNRDFILKYFPDSVSALCETTEERKEAIEKMIEKSDAKMIYVLSDTYDDVYLLNDIAETSEAKIHFLGSAINFHNYFKYWVSRRPRINPKINLYNYKNDWPLLSLLTMALLDMELTQIYDFFKVTREQD